MSALPGTWRYEVGGRTGRSGVIVLRLDSIKNLICCLRDKYLSRVIPGVFFIRGLDANQWRKISVEATRQFTFCWFSVAAVCLLDACLTSKQHASVPQGRICSDNFTCYHNETKVADQTFYLTQSQYTDTGPPVPQLTL